MKKRRPILNIIFAVLTVFHLMFLQSLSAQSTSPRLPTTHEFKAAVLKQAEQRQKHVDDIRTFLRQDVVRKNFSQIVELDKLQMKVATLDDETLAELARETRLASEQIQGGISTTVVLVIVIAVLIVVIALLTSEPST